jgi:hypothetical protein
MKLTIDGLRLRDEMVFERCRRLGLPMAVSMSGGYAPDIDAIVTIHANTIRTASHFASVRLAPLAPVAAAPLAPVAPAPLAPLAP